MLFKICRYGLEGVVPKSSLIDWTELLIKLFVDQLHGITAGKQLNGADNSQILKLPFYFQLVKLKLTLMQVRPQTPEVQLIRVLKNLCHFVDLNFEFLHQRLALSLANHDIADLLADLQFAGCAEINAHYQYFVSVFFTHSRNEILHVLWRVPYAKQVFVEFVGQNALVVGKMAGYFV